MATTTYQLKILMKHSYSELESEINRFFVNTANTASIVKFEVIDIQFKSKRVSKFNSVHRAFITYLAVNLG